MADENVMPRKPLDGGDGTYQNNEGKVILKTEEVHTKMLELLAKTKFSMYANESAKEKISNIEKQLNVEITKACSNNENPDGNKSLEQLTLTLKSLLASLTSMYEEEEKNFALTCKQLDGADEHVDQMQQLDDPGGKTSDNVEKK